MPRPTRLGPRAAGSDDRPSGEEPSVGDEERGSRPRALGPPRQMARSQGGPVGSGRRWRTAPRHPTRHRVNPRTMDFDPFRHLRLEFGLLRPRQVQGPAHQRLGTSPAAPYFTRLAAQWLADRKMPRILDWLLPHHGRYPSGLAATTRPLTGERGRAKPVRPKDRPDPGRARKLGIRVSATKIHDMGDDCERAGGRRPDRGRRVGHRIRTHPLLGFSLPMHRMSFRTSPEIARSWCRVGND
jgi:hypothetical protein